MNRIDPVIVAKFWWGVFEQASPSTCVELSAVNKTVNVLTRVFCRINDLKPKPFGFSVNMQSDLSLKSQEARYVQRLLEKGHNLLVKPLEIDEILKAEKPTIAQIDTLYKFIRAVDTLMFWKELIKELEYKKVELVGGTDIEVLECMTLCSEEEITEFLNEFFGKWLEDNKSAIDCIDFLDLSKKNLSFLPKEIGQLSGLKKLNLKDNQLISLPQEMVILSNLKEILVNRDQVALVPEELIGRVKVVSG